MNYYLQSWPTPTPLPTPDIISATPVFTAMEGVDTSLAEWTVQGYQAANSAGVVDFIMLAVFALIIVGGVLSIIKHLQRL